MSRSDRLLMGRVAGVHGVRGWLKVRSHARPPEAILDYQPWTLRQLEGERSVRVLESRLGGRGLQVLLPGIHDRASAEALVGAEIWVARSALPAPAPDEYYWTDLEGLEVVTTEGITLGRVSHLLETGANDVLVVAGERERLIPFVQGTHVVAVDLAAGRITVDWDPGF